MNTLDQRRYQVFVSSTFKDLEKERQEVLQAILELRAFPVGMEMFPAADDDQWTFIKEEIDSSDYYVVIVAGKYGSVGDDGISYTEMEYDYAVSRNKQVLGFLFHDLTQLPVRASEQDPEVRAKHDKFYQKVRSRRLVKFYKDSSDLKARVLQSLGSAFRRHPQAGWIPATEMRRLEDVEEISRLQKELMAAKEELEALRASARDPRERLAHGRDIETWQVELILIPYQSRDEYGSPNGGVTKLDPPETFCELKQTWERLFTACFSSRKPIVYQSTIEAAISMLIGEQLPPVIADSEWGCQAKSRGFHGCFARQSLMFIIDAVSLQFSGLGYIQAGTERENSYSTAFWQLTDRGATYAATLLGSVKSTP